MEEKPGTPEPDKEQQHSDEDELEDLKAPADSQEEVLGGCLDKNPGTCEFTSTDYLD
jgi:hypothetical protein